MASLKNPNGQVPGGFQYYVADTRWKPAPFSSLDSITQQLISHRRGRPDLVAKHGWSLDPAVVRQEVEQYNVAVCVRNGWFDYIVGGVEATLPFHPPPQRSIAQRAKQVVAGGEVLVQWIESGAEAVPVELASARAEICAACALNKPGGWESFFTVPVSNAIRAALEKRKSLNLSTPSDDKLAVCQACLCPLPLKVHMPIGKILPKMPKESFDALAENCWIRSEAKTT